MRPLAEGWRLGSLLLDTAGGLWAAGRATRAAERGRIGYQSLSREDRRDLAAAALRGGYPVGTTVHFDAHPLRLDEASVRSFDGATQIGWVDGQVRVRWHVGAPLTGAPTLEQYLSERVGLLIDPPLGAS